MRFSPAFTGGILRPFPSECNDVTDFASRLEVHTGPLESFAPYHLSGILRHPLSFSRTWPPPRISFTARDLPGSPLSPVCQSKPGPPQGDKTYTIEVQGAAKTVSIDRLKSVYVLHVDTESFSPHFIPSGLTTRSGRRVRFPDYLGIQRSQRGGGGEVDTAV